MSKLKRYLCWLFLEVLVKLPINHNTTVFYCSQSARQIARILSVLLYDWPKQID